MAEGMIHVDPRGSLATSREPRSGDPLAVSVLVGAKVSNVTRVAYHPERSGGRLALVRKLPAGREPADRRRPTSQAFRPVAFV
ncbi:MAG: hypothetical protein OHK0022_16950 [Roseiflexaceae bacterium]